jgi:hypothetical protein
MHITRLGHGLIIVLMVVMAAKLSASNGTRQVPVEFADGTARTQVSGHIAGRDSVDHVVPAAAGQTLAVTLSADSPMAYFNVLPPGSEEAVFIGSTSGNTFRGVLENSGDHTIRVYLMRAGARRGESSNYTLDVLLRQESTD